MPTESEAEAVPFAVSEGRLWQRITYVALVVTMIGATVGVLGIVVRNSVLLGRMTTDVSVAQQRTTNLHNLQLATLHLLLELTQQGQGDSTDEITVRRGLLGRMFTVVDGLFPAGSAQVRELRAIQASLDRFSWSRLDGTTTDWDVAIISARGLVSQTEVQVKGMYDEQEQFFYGATRQSLQAKRDSQNALAVLMTLVIIMAACWLVLLRRRTRSRLVQAYDALVAEVSERRTLQDQLTHQAFHDALTGLPNRALFVRRLADSIQAPGEATGAPSAVLVDLDGFKNVNDTLGHGAGDELLRVIAERLRDCVRAGDTVSRLGGDEFALVIVREDPLDGAVAASRRLIEAIQRPIPVAGQEVSINASVGIAHLDGQAGAEELLADADIAMYAAKKAGKARYEVFRSDMRDQTRRRVRLEQQLARAVEAREIEVFYQPIVALDSGRVTAVEALARWRHPEDGLIPPGTFIPVAEESGLIREIGRDVLRQACATVQRWRHSVPGCTDLIGTVNVSVRQLQSGTFSAHLDEALQESGLPPAALTLEITESLLLDESDIVTAELGRIKSRGVRLAMDDFGAGYSSVASLLRLQVSVLKIDKTFLDLDNSNQGTLIRAVTELGHTLGLTVVAEGVETEDQLAHVRRANCDSVQGFLLSRPLPEHEAHSYLSGSVPEGVPLRG
ncbi:EAL domain-containing protein [Actinoplanes sp. NPDC026619]|uniref:putative bifunctional diguanylate cyclase/phosphodiesterase n=1 Tax=Actinoplanes sp. NPDC026619 TaxID=3155798 RepID=UPI0033D0FF7A